MNAAIDRSADTTRRNQGSENSHRQNRRSRQSRSGLEELNNGTNLPEEQFISLFPVESAAESLPKRDGNRYTENRTPRGASHRWSQKRNKSDDTAWKNREAEQSKENTLTEEDFPSLGTDVFDARFTTPENNKLDWGSRVEQEEQTTTLRYKRKLLLSQEDHLRNSKRKPKVSKPILTDVHKLAQRQKQIDIGKNTVAYGRYIAALPKENRQKGVDAITPDKLQVCSTRSWVGQIRLWRRRLHLWDPPQNAVEDIFSVSSQSSSSSQSTDDCKMDVVETDTLGDLFKDFDLDACLTNDGLPL